MAVEWRGVSEVLPWAEAAVRTNPNGSQSRDFGHGALSTGERVRVHATVQPPGMPPNPAHRIEHTELICVETGVLEFEHEGHTARAAAGDVVFVAKGTLHAVRNAGEEPVRYVVVSIGGDVS